MSLQIVSNCLKIQRSHVLHIFCYSPNSSSSNNSSNNNSKHNSSNNSNRTSTMPMVQLMGWQRLTASPQQHPLIMTLIMKSGGGSVALSSVFVYYKLPQLQITSLSIICKSKGQLQLTLNFVFQCAMSTTTKKGHQATNCRSKPQHNNANKFLMCKNYLIL